jgi:hypothetical protein
MNLEKRRSQKFAKEVVTDRDQVVDGWLHLYKSEIAVSV